MKLVEEIFSAHARSTEIIVASRYKETAVYCIENFEKLQRNSKTNVHAQTQLSLF